MKFSLKHINFTLFLGISICIFFFLIYKAERTSFTHDESYSLTHYAYQTAKSIRTYKTPYTNNHILNSLGMKVCSGLFGDSELSLRLPNILAFLVYISFFFLTTRKIAPPLVLPILVLGGLNPYLLDFFALARGYGISIAFMAAAFWGLLRFLELEKHKFLLAFHAFAFLAIYGNFSLLIFYLAALATLYTRWLMKSLFFPGEPGQLMNTYRAHLLNGMGISWIAYAIWEPISKILAKDMLNFGGKSDFFSDTIGSLVPRLVNYQESMGEVAKWVIASVALALLLFSLGMVWVFLLKKHTGFWKSQVELMASSLTLFFIFLGSTLQHYLLGTDYPIERFALFLFPLFVLNLAFLLDFLYKQTHRRRLASAMAIALALMTLFNSSRNLNADYFLDWRYDRETKNAFWTLRKDHELHAEDPCKNLSLGVSWLFEPTMAYYRFTTQFWVMEEVNRDGLKVEDTYVYAFEEDLDEAGIPFRDKLMCIEELSTILVKNRPN